MSSGSDSSDSDLSFVSAKNLDAESRTGRSQFSSELNLVISDDDDADVEDFESSRKENSYTVPKARRTLEFSREEIVDVPVHSPKATDSETSSKHLSSSDVSPSDKEVVCSPKQTSLKTSLKPLTSRRRSRRTTVGKTETETDAKNVLTRSARNSTTRAENRRSVRPTQRFGFEIDDSSSRFELKSRPRRRYTDFVPQTPDKTTKSTRTSLTSQSLRPVRQCRSKAASISTPKNTVNESKDSGRVTTRALRSRTRSETKLKSDSSDDEKPLISSLKRRRKTCSPRTLRKSTVYASKAESSSVKERSISSLKRGRKTCSPRMRRKSTVNASKVEASSDEEPFINSKRRKTCSPRTRTKSTENSARIITLPKTEECDQLILNFKREGETWSAHTPTKSVPFPSEDRSASSRSKKLAKSGQDTNESTSRRSSRARKSFVPFQIPVVDVKNERTPTRGRGRPRKYSTSSVLEVDDGDWVDDRESSVAGSDDEYEPCSRDDRESSLDDSDDEYEPSSRHSKSPGRALRSKIGSETPKTPRTPRTPRMSVNALTPSLPTRSSIVSTPTTPKDRAMKALHISSVPESLPCRKREFDTIYNFLVQKIRGLDGGFMYMYGIPGAGKTATVERVIKRLLLESNKKKVNKFKFVDINGMHLKKPKDAYCQIWKKLENDFVSAKRAKNLLEDKFRTVFSKQPLLLLIDEFDMLFNRTLSVVDTILDWIEQSKLIVVAIANSKDLIEEINKSSSKSRMLRERLCDVQFKTYTYQQLQEIIEDRLKHDNVFTSDAIQLLARKSALSGDVRLALNLCRRVLAEAGDINAKETVGVGRVAQLLEQIHKDPKIEFMKALSAQEQTLLQAIRDAILTSGCSTCSLEKNVYHQYKARCIFNDVKVRDDFSLFRILRLLETYAIVTLSDSDCTIHTEISLGNNLDYVQMAFPPNKQ